MNDEMRTPTELLSDWFSHLDAALTAGDADSAANLFQEESYWRDLVSFTWNIKTMEGPDAIREMLAARLADVQPSNWQVEGEATGDSALTEGCQITNETVSCFVFEFQRIFADEFAALIIATACQRLEVETTSG